jgi:5-formyltetrahydrofolate cyclo-ligase
MNVEKRVIRQRLREQRRALPARTVEAAGRAVRAQLLGFPPYVTALSVMGYVAHENEVPTTELLDEAARRGRSLLLPRITPPVGMVRWRPGEALVVDCYGVWEPANSFVTRPELPAVALVPIVAWDRQGNRLGRGGGFYDRLFAELTGITRIGLAYEFQECPGLPRDPWDVPVDYVITERRIVQCGGVEASFQKGGLQFS